MGTRAREVGDRGPQSNRLQVAPPATPLFSNFYLFMDVMMKFGDGLGIWENECTTLPVFEPCSYT
jgi:hypothetical protein